MWLCGRGGFRKGKMATARGILFRWKLFPSICSDARHFSFSPYSTGVLESCCPGTGVQRERVWVSPQSVMGPLKWDTWESWSFFHCPNPYWFYSQKLWGLTFLVPEPWAGWSAVGPRSLAPEVTPLIFIHHVCVWDQPLYVSMSPCHCVFTPPTCLSERDFFNSLVGTKEVLVGLPCSLIFWQFWMIVVL